MLGPTCYEFAYTQAPASMKTTMTAVWLLMKSFGNVLVIILHLLHAFKKQVTYFTDCFYIHFCISIF
jgi:dipeptide/tripeptide permease